MTTVTVAGTTGLVGNHIRNILTQLPNVTLINAFTRKDLPENPKVKSIKAQDHTTWPSLYPKDSALFISSLGTTRANAGSIEAQRKIDLDLNLDLAKAAKAAGTKAYVLISGHGANPSSINAYIKMKGELEEAVKALQFEHCIILRPGLIVGDRSESRMAEGVARKLAGFMGSVGGNRLKDFWAQDADVIAKAAVRAGLDALEGKGEAGVRILVQGDIVRLGRTEWKD